MTLTPYLLTAAGLGLLVACYIAYPTAVIGAISPRPFGWLNVLSALAFALLLAGLLLTPSMKNGFLKNCANKLAHGLGAVSYGVYLLHGLVLGLMSGVFATELEQVLASTLVTLVLAAVVYRWFEQPSRNWGRR